MGFLEVLTIIFIVLKVLGIIAWSWWVVLSPFLFSLGIYLLLFFGVISLASLGIRKARKP